MTASLLSRACASAVLLAGLVSPAASEDLFSALREVALRQLAGHRRQKIDAIATREQFELRRAEVRRRLLEMMGGLPERRGPLNVRRMGASTAATTGSRN